MNTSLSMAAPWWRPNTGHRLIVRGGRPLVGTYPISGAKNAVLPLMVSALLTPHLVTLRNVPANLDVAVLAALLQRLGCGMHWSTSELGHRRDDRGRSRAAAADRCRAGHPHARFGVAARRAAGPLRRGGAPDAGRRCHRSARHRFPCRGPARHGCHDRAHRRHDPRDRTRWAARRRYPAAPAVGRRHRESLVGSRCCGGHDDHPQCRPGTGDRRSRNLPDRDGRQDRRPRHARPDHRGRCVAGRCRPHRAARSHRVRHARLRRRADRRRIGLATRTRRVAGRCRSVVRCCRRRTARYRRWRGRPPGQGWPGRRRSHDRPLSRIRDRPAGPNDGAVGCGRGDERNHRKHFRAALPSCRRAAKDGRGHRRSRPARRGSGASSDCMVPPSPAPTYARRRPSSLPAWAPREKRPSTVSTIWIAATMA